MFTLEAAIFDLDGVIVDTAKYHYLAWKRLAAELGFDFTLKDNERLKGISRIQSLEIILEIGGITTTEAQKLEWTEQKNGWYLEYIHQLTPVEIFPGAASLLSYLRGQGIKIALGSASKNARLILENLQLTPMFDAIVDGNMVSNSKPDPEVFLRAVRELGIAPEKCLVFEDAASGVEAARRAGMKVVGIGDRQNLNRADLVVRDFPTLNFRLVTGEPTTAEWLLTEAAFNPEQIELNGSKFLLGNGYLGYRGTLEEYTREEQVALTLAGIYDRKDNGWREPVNAPNGFYTSLSWDQQPPGTLNLTPEEHSQSLDLYCGIHRRETLFSTAHHQVTVKAERFLSLDNVHLMVLKYCFRSERDCRITIRTGIDGAVWDINGPHLATINFEATDQQLTAVATTNEGDTVAVAEMLQCDFGIATVNRSAEVIEHLITLTAAAGCEYCFYKYVSVFTSKDGESDPLDSAIANNREAERLSYDALYLRHAQLWHERWLGSDIIIEGDPEAQFGIRYSLYQLYTAAPSHTDKVSIPARGLSGQTYKGAIFWDTELFMLSFFCYTNPDLAKNLVKYRVHTLDGARRKAVEYGYQGAFYAWESQETGDDACTLFNVTDVFSGRPMRTYFRDKQIHISADVVYGIWQYYTVTGDQNILLEGGAEVILECARFFYSYAYFKKDRNRYELVDVTGPDEYHERVSNNAFTNYLVKRVLEIALEVLESLATNHQSFYQSLIARLDLEAIIPALREMKALLYLPAPHPETGVIEQFDGYHRLEDVTLQELKSRIIKPHEYLGGGNGLATTTKIIKQGDVLALMFLCRNDFPERLKRANWEYYEPRTEHGSSLSPCLYAILAAENGKPDWAYPYFMQTATIDLSGAYKRYVGDLYIGGTHPAANGGAWMATVHGFGGLNYDGNLVSIKPALPKHWQSLRFNIQIRNQRFKIAITNTRVKVTAALQNTELIPFRLRGEMLLCPAGQEITVGEV